MTTVNLTIARGGEMGVWISVEDMLPDGPQRVLVSTKECGRLVCGLAGNWNEFDVFIPNRWGCINDICFDLDEVTHWQPLPEPPK